MDNVTKAQNNALAAIDAIGKKALICLCCCYCVDNEKSRQRKVKRLSGIKETDLGSFMNDQLL